MENSGQIKPEQSKKNNTHTHTKSNFCCQNKIQIHIQTSVYRKSNIWDWNKRSSVITKHVLCANVLTDSVLSTSESYQKIVPAMKWLSVIFLHSQCCFIVNSFFKTADFFNLSKFFAPSSLQKCLAHWFDLCQDSELYFYSKCQIYKFCVLIHRYFHLSVLNVTFLYFKTLKTLLFLGKKRKKKKENHQFSYSYTYDYWYRRGWY